MKKSSWILNLAAVSLLSLLFAACGDEDTNADADALLGAWTGAGTGTLVVKGTSAAVTLTITNSAYTFSAGNTYSGSMKMTIALTPAQVMTVAESGTYTRTGTNGGTITFTPTTSTVVLDGATQTPDLSADTMSYTLANNTLKITMSGTDTVGTTNANVTLSK